MSETVINKKFYRTTNWLIFSTYLKPFTFFVFIFLKFNEYDKLVDFSFTAQVCLRISWVSIQNTRKNTFNNREISYVYRKFTLVPNTIWCDIEYVLNITSVVDF